ncbi:hypothetical protein DFH28DRAFT_956401 [Melampsora americana]|nr:hypothetical protein DFH28DRAFT_956401 [Melampsora americana]
MKITMKNIILFFYVQVLIFTWEGGSHTLASPVSSSTTLRPHFHICIGDELNTLHGSLKTYMEKPIEERRASNPFFEISRVDELYTHSINQILITEKKDWSQQIREILKIGSSQEKIPLWNFLKELTYHMPTSAVQLTLIEAWKEEKMMMKEIEEGLLHPNLENMKSITVRCMDEMEDHVNSLKSNKFSCREPERFEDIFNYADQKKLGSYRITLENQWLTNDQQNHLFQFWGSHMNIYLDVEDSIRSIIEKQVMVMRLTLERLKYYQISDTFPYFTPLTGSLLHTLVGELSYSIVMLNDEQLRKFARIQLKLRYGFHTTSIEDADILRDLLVFWSENIIFHLRFIDFPNRELSTIENYFLHDEERLEAFLEDFRGSPENQLTPNVIDRLLNEL